MAPGWLTDETWISMSVRWHSEVLFCTEGANVFNHLGGTLRTLIKWRLIWCSATLLLRWATGHKSPGKLKEGQNWKIPSWRTRFIILAFQAPAYILYAACRFPPQLNWTSLPNHIQSQLKFLKVFPFSKNLQLGRCESVRELVSKRCKQRFYQRWLYKRIYKAKMKFWAVFIIMQLFGVVFSTFCRQNKNLRNI